MMACLDNHRHTWEAVQVDSSQKLEESNTMLRELCKVLVNHVKCRLEDGFKNRGDLWCEQILESIGSMFSLKFRRYLHPTVK